MNISVIITLRHVLPYCPFKAEESTCQKIYQEYILFFNDEN